MTQQPEISVLLPVYNSEKFVFDAVQSILNQSHADFELLLIDDGSSDNSAQILKAISDSRIRYIRNEQNRGLIASLNHGLESARGQYIARMDADDIAFPDRLEKQVNFLRTHPEVGICGTHFISFGNKSSSSPALPTSDDTLRISLIFRSALAHPTVMMRKSVLDKYNLKYNADYPSAEDYKLWTDFALHCKMANLKHVLLKYRIHENQITQTKVEQKETSLKNIHATYFKALGILASTEELDLHYRLSGGRGARNPEELRQTLHWLNKLREQLLRIQFAPQEIVDKQLSAELKKTCENSGLGLIAWNVWKSCTWKLPLATLKDMAGFYFKIFTRYKAH